MVLLDIGIYLYKILYSCKDRRVRLLEEMISSMRIIKMYVWEGQLLKIFKNLKVPSKVFSF